jgi:hypothetical protein
MSRPPTRFIRRSSSLLTSIGCTCLKKNLQISELKQRDEGREKIEEGRGKREEGREGDVHRIYF